MAKIDVKQVVAANVQALLDYAKRQGLPWTSPRALAIGTEKRFGDGNGVGQTTIKAILKGDRGTGVDTLDKIARMFGMQAWQLLLPDMQPDPEKRPEVAVTEAHRRVLAALDEDTRVIRTPVGAVSGRALKEVAAEYQKESSDNADTKEHVGYSAANEHRRRGAGAVKQPKRAQPVAGRRKTPSARS